MKNLVVNLLLIFVFCAFAGGQDLSGSQNLNELNRLHLKAEDLKNSIEQMESRLDALVTELSKIDRKDIAEAERLGARVERLFPCCPLAGEEREMFGMDSGYSFRPENAGDAHFATHLMYENDRFRFSKGYGSHGFIFDMGKYSFEKVNEQTPEFIALAKYKAPSEIESVKEEFVSDRFRFQSEIPVVIGSTYLLRVVNYEFDSTIDGIFAVKVLRRDTDGSIIVFVKKIKLFEPPKLNKKPKYDLSQIHRAGQVIKIRDRLRELGFKDVQVEYVERDLFVRGSVFPGKIEEVLKIIKEIAPYDTIKNELVEK